MRISNFESQFSNVRFFDFTMETIKTIPISIYYDFFFIQIFNLNFKFNKFRTWNFYFPIQNSNWRYFSLVLLPIEQ